MPSASNIGSAVRTGRFLLALLGLLGTALPCAASGIYFVQLQSGKIRETRRIVFMR